TPVGLLEGAVEVIALVGISTGVGNDGAELVGGGGDGGGLRLALDQVGLVPGNAWIAVRGAGGDNDQSASVENGRVGGGVASCLDLLGRSAGQALVKVKSNRVVARRFVDRFGETLLIAEERYREPQRLVAVEEDIDLTRVAGPPDVPSRCAGPPVDDHRVGIVLLVPLVIPPMAGGRRAAGNWFLDLQSVGRRRA